MKPFVMIALNALMALSAPAQKLETQSVNPSKVIRVETAKDHLTVIELSDAVTMVAVGNRSAFTVERREVLPGNGRVLYLLRKRRAH